MADRRKSPEKPVQNDAMRTQPTDSDFDRLMALATEVFAREHGRRESDVRDELRGALCADDLVERLEMILDEEGSSGALKAEYADLLQAFTRLLVEHRQGD